AKRRDPPDTTTPATAATSSGSCPDGAALLAAADASPALLPPGVAASAFTEITCWQNWAAALAPQYLQGWVVFDEVPTLHYATDTERADFAHELCASPSAPAIWKTARDLVGPAGC